MDLEKSTTANLNFYFKMSKKIDCYLKSATTISPAASSPPPAATSEIVHTPPSPLEDQAKRQRIDMTDKLDNLVAQMEKVLETTAQTNRTVTQMQRDFAATNQAVKSLTVKVNSIELSLNDLTIRSQEAENKIESVVEQNENIVQRLDNLEAENRKLRQDLKDEGIKRDNIENTTRKYMLEFSGVPQLDNETNDDCRKICAKILTLAGLADPLKTIDLAHRKANQVSIICKFKSRYEARQAYAVRFKLKGISSSQIPGYENNHEDNDLYINESLTFDRSRIRAQIAAKVKALNNNRDKPNWIKVTTSDGEIKVGVGKETRKCPTLEEFDKRYPNSIPVRSFAR